MMTMRLFRLIEKRLRKESNISIKETPIFCHRYDHISMREGLDGKVENFNQLPQEVQVGHKDMEK